jgi:hypothetical protein
MSNQCSEGFVAIDEDSLRIFTLEKVNDALFHQVETPLLHTPRKLVLHQPTNRLVVIETGIVIECEESCFLFSLFLLLCCLYN